MQELLRQCFVQFRCQLIEIKQIDNEAIFIDGTKIEANANKFTFVWKKAIVRYQTNLIEKSQAVYDELLDQSIILAIQRENEEELTLPELVKVIEAVDEVVKDFDQQMRRKENTYADNVSIRKPCGKHGLTLCYVNKNTPRT